MFLKWSPQMQVSIPMIENMSVTISAVFLPSFAKGPLRSDPNKATKGTIEVRIGICSIFSLILHLKRLEIGSSAIFKTETSYPKKKAPKAAFSTKKITWLWRLISFRGFFFFI